MSVEVIRQRVDQYDPKSDQDKENVTKEIMQEVLLLALSRSEFFKKAAFQGGTALRILYGLDRFSEDLDFVLFESDPNFKVGIFLKSIKAELEAYGFDLEVTDKTNLETPIQKVEFKDSSIGKILNIKGFSGDRPRKIVIKLEIDINPPSGSKYESKFLTFPTPFDTVAQDVPSLFESKSHALLCRSYDMGRDWYDFIWYCNRQATVNYDLLSGAIDQLGPWEGQKIKASKEWYADKMRQKINSIDWKAVRQDVQRFLRPHQLESLKLWSAELFLDCLSRWEQKSP